MKMSIIHLLIILSEVFKPTQSLHKAYMNPTCFCPFWYKNTRFVDINLKYLPAYVAKTQSFLCMFFH